MKVLGIFILEEHKFHRNEIGMLIPGYLDTWVPCGHIQTSTALAHHIIISGFGIYGAAVVPDSGVGNTWQRLTLVLHEFLSNGLTT